MKKETKRVRVETLCDQEIVDRLDSIIRETGTTRNFLIRKAIRLYLDHREFSKRQQKTVI